MNLYRFRNIKVLAAALLVILSVSILSAQSNDQNFPTPVTSNEIAGMIKARDIGDSRVTTYFYAFNGTQGDIFINVVTRNFIGDIDIYLLDGLRPLTKMVIYADSGSNETGRLVYLRKSERLILRIEGRTPNDDPATFRIKFGGSFVAMSPKSKDGALTTPKITSSDDTGVAVNSVGTILTDVSKSSSAARSDSSRKIGNSTPPTNSSKVPAPSGNKSGSMANIQLRIYFKDGKTIVFPMSEVVNFTVESGILTVINKSGNISRYSFPEVARVAIQ